jgi:hypothetical protein
MSEITKNDTVSTETAQNVPNVKDVLEALVDGVSRPESGFDRLDRKGRGLVRSGLKSRFSRLMGEGPGSFEKAQFVYNVLEVTLKAGSTPKPEIDQKAAMSEFVAILRYAANALVAGEVAFDGFDPIELDETDIPDMTDEMVETAMKLANRKIGRKSPTNDVAAATRSAFANVPVGTYMKVSDIRKNMDKSYKSDASWDGRISARLFPESGICTVEGIVPVPVGPDGKKGAKKVEADIWDVTDDSDNADD